MTLSGKPDASQAYCKLRHEHGDSSIGLRWVSAMRACICPVTYSGGYEDGAKGMPRTQLAARFLT